ncbi:MAG TPA: amino acid adenylation domain-containing protein [Lacunisphaera sp.]|nr:amino acid adenylation domain-containing protein [Lacunisphaera sp.]
MSNDPTPEAVAIIGMAGRFPQAKNLAEFWQNLRSGREAVSFFKDEEVQWLPIENPPRLDDPAFVKARAVLERPEWFDAAFFGMNPREAAVMDPQHRVFLECAWEALEDAGCNPETFPGAIGVFAGASMNSYLFSNLLTNRGLVENLGFFPTFLANDNDFVPTRVSYKLNLRGPSINVQTACSTSLVAVCLAVQNLLAYRCDAALAGGVSITFPARRGQYHLAGGILSHDGHCRAFSANASGTVLGDGAGVVMLKRLGDALAAGDNIRAVIRGTAINNDGAVKIGYTAPSSDGQAEAIALAHAEAGFPPETVSYIEAHGTGTPLGDPIEVEGLKKAFGLQGERGQFCGLGSVKTNIGHLDITAGVAGLIKTVLALEARELPPSLHFDQPNPKIDFAHSPFYVVNSVRPWPRGATPRRAGVSSFGIGGTNAHVALEEAPARPASAPGRSPELLVLSARSPAALDQAAANLAHHLEAQPQLNLADVAATLQTGRKAFSHRRIVVADDGADAIRRLRAASEPGTGLAAGTTPPVVFLFPGQGVQYANMGHGLYQAEPVFRQSVDECCRILAPRLGLDLRSLLFPAAAHHETAVSRLNETSITQPALFVIEYSLAQLWRRWGVKPAALAGHSLGEYVAACLAGVFSLEDALLLVAERARLMQAQPRGTMLAVRLPEAEVAPLATGAVALAAVNAPDLCVLAGPHEAIDALAESLAADGVGVKRLNTSHAFHSAMMEPVLAPFAATLRQVRLQAPNIPCLSNVTGTWLTAAQATDPGYWTTHLRQAVRFADGVATLFQEMRPVLLEVGPGQALGTLARQHPAAAGQAMPVSSLGRGGQPGDTRSIAEALGRLWMAGVDVDWPAWQGAPRRRVPLPTYPFERQRHWIEPGKTEDRMRRTEDGHVIAAEAPSSGHPPLSPDSCPPSSVLRPPSSDVRSRLAALLTEFAGHDFTGDNAGRTFQELGLDSLLLTQLSFALQDRFAAHVTMRQLIESYSSLDKLAAHLEGSAEPFEPTCAAATAAPAPVADDLVPLTEAQQEIWYASQLGPDVSAAYNESFALQLHGPLDESILRAALTELANRHESLRSTFPAGGGQQRIAAAATPDFTVIDLTGLPAGEQETRRQSEQDRVIRETFDLVNGPLWRVRALRTAPDRHALVFAVHHIICDGWSQGVMAHELAELYSARRAGRTPQLPPPARFSDYARQEARRLEQPETAAGDYWASRFADGVPVLDLPADRPRPAMRTYAAAHLHRRLQPATAAAIRQLAAQTNSTHFTVLLAAFNTLLHRLSGQDDVVVGVPASPQVLAGLKTLVGHCVNLLPIRSQLGAGQSVADFLQATRQVTLDGFEHWQHPFARLLRRLNLPRDPNRVPLANVTFNVSRHRGMLAFDGLVVEAATNPKGFVNFDINFNVTETDRDFAVDCNYSTELFDADTIARTLDRYELVLCAAAANAQCPVERLPFVTPAERQKILFDWNQTEKEYPRDQCLHELFEEQAARTPDATALVWGTQRWTYRQLDERANRLAHLLRRVGVKPETPVGVHAARTPETVAAFFAILKAGGAYIPLDPAYPADRVKYMLEDSRAAVLITDRSRAGAPPPFAGTTIDLGDAQDTILREAPTKPISYPHPGNLAYVIYTSGSTGRPKGVAIEHRNAVSLAYWGRDVFSPEELSGVFAGTSFCFDLSIFELFVTLAWGGTAHLAENALALGTIPTRQEITLINSVPSVVAELVRLSLIPTSVQTIFMAGEATPDSLAERLLAIPHLRKVYEGYGPSEDTTFSSWGLRQPGVRSNLGRPFPNTQFYVLDRNLELVPPGVVGEICIAGEGLARGYLNQPGLTQEKFVRNPHSSAPAARLYRSGDLARQRPDNGLLEFAGRLDHQVKIRGFRVELGEIQSALCRHPQVRQAVVVVHESTPGDKRIVAYVTPPAPDQLPDAAALRAHLAAQLPEYMVPAVILPMPTFPLTANGKVDRKALPLPESAGAVPAATSPAPRTVTEEILAEIWCDVLRVPRVGVHDNFFELGGHSLLVTQALARIQQAFEIELPLRLAFEAPTIAGLAGHLEQALAGEIEASSEETESASAVA